MWKTSELQVSKLCVSVPVRVRKTHQTELMNSQGHSFQEAVTIPTSNSRIHTSTKTACHTALTSCSLESSGVVVGLVCAAAAVCALVHSEIYI